jgi:hypothetical protein
MQATPNPRVKPASPRGEDGGRRRSDGVPINRWRLHIGAAAVVIGLGAGLAACGGSSSGKTTSTATTPKPAPATIHLVLTATNHTPVANKPWHYGVRATDSAGKPVSARVRAQVLSQGQVVGQIDNGSVHNAPTGVWTEEVTWPPASVGQPLVMQVVVTALGTTATVNYTIQVKAS